MGYPLTIDSFTTKENDVTDVLATHINDLQTAIVALQTKVGVDNSIVETTIEYKVAAKENSSNKVTSISGSSTDTQYPSAKLVYDQLATKLATSAFTDTSVTGKLLTGYSSGAGTVAATDTILQAIQKLNGNISAITIPVKATGAELNTGTDDVKFATAKALADSKYITYDGVETLTNKRNQPRVYSTTTLTTLTPEVDTYNVFALTAQAEALTIANHSTSTPANGEMILIRATCDGTARALSFGTNYVFKMGFAQPTTLVANKMTTFLGIWCSEISKYNMTVGQE